MKTACVWVLLCLAAWGQSPLVYQVTIDPGTLSHVEVAITLPPDLDGELTLRAPAWHPSRWRRLRAPAIEGMTASTADGTPVVVSAEENAWSVAPARGKTRKVTWKIGRTRQRLNVREHLTKTSALLFLPTTLLLPMGEESRPCELTVKAPPGWTTVSSLESAKTAARCSAPDWHTLVDTPLLIGSTLEEHAFDHDNIPHRVVIDRGDLEQPFPSGEVLEMLKKVVAAQTRLLGPPLHARYLFVLIPEAEGSRWYRNAVTIGVGGRDRLAPVRAAAAAGVRSRLPARVRPDFMAEPALHEEPETPTLWFIDGLASWFSRRTLLEAGLHDPTGFLESLQKRVLEYRNDLNAPYISAAATSQAIWDGVRTLSPGLVGDVLALALDADIRTSTENERSLADVVQRAAERFREEKGFSATDVKSLLEEASGHSLETFFASHIEGKTPPPIEKALSQFGLAIEWIRWRVKDPRLPVAAQGRFLFVQRLGFRNPLRSVGLREGDRIISVNQRRCRTQADVDRQIARLRPGQKLRVDIRRDDKLKSFRITLEPDVALRIPVDERDSHLVIEALPPGPLRDAGLRAGDVLEKIGKRRIGRERDITSAMLRIQQGKAVLTIRRGEKRMRISVPAPARAIWRCALIEDAKASPLARKIRDDVLGSNR